MEIVAEDMYESLGKWPSARVLWLKLSENTHQYKYIQEIDNELDTMYWATANGIQKQTSFAAFSNKYSEYKTKRS